MAQHKRFAYSVILAASVFFPAWGCSNEPPEPPPGAPKDTGAGFQPPDVELPTQSQGTTTSSAKDKKASAPEPEKKK